MHRPPAAPNAAQGPAAARSNCTSRSISGPATRIGHTAADQNGSLMPGGNGRPPVSAFIFSAQRLSALVRASSWAVTIRSSRISVSSGFSRLGRSTGLQPALGGERDPHQAAARLALDDRLFELGLRFGHLGLHACACFISPMKSIIALLRRRPRSAPLRLHRRFAARDGSRSPAAHRDDLRAGKARQHARDQADPPRARSGAPLLALRAVPSSVGCAARARRPTTIQRSPVHSCSLLHQQSARVPDAPPGASRIRSARARTGPDALRIRARS